MKNIKIWMLLLLLGFTGAGCDKDFDEINTNPNDPEEVPLTNILISGISQGVRRVHGANFDATYAGLWAQHYAKIQYIDEDWYEYRPDAFDTHWQGLYAGPLMDLTDVINRAPNPSNMRAAAMVMRAYYFAIITDMWGDVPYSEALSIDRVTNPKYDSQADIYAALVSELRTAATMFDASGDDLGAGDLIYAGDVNKWRKFANSLRARLLNRAKHKNPAFATELQSLLNNPADLIAGNSENAQMSYFDATPDGSNPLYNNKYNDGRNDHAVSETLVTIMQNDPRLSVYAEPADGGVYKGQPNGTVEPNPFTSVSQIGAAFRDDPTAPSVLMTYSEVLFIIAEAKGDKQAFLDGITASCSQHGVSADQAFLDAKAAEYDANPLDAIITQKWVALFGNGCEAFTEFRRTGYPNEIVEVPGTAYPGQGVPRRFAYPTSETSNNKANLEAAIAAQGLASDPSKIFGDYMWWRL